MLVQRLSFRGFVKGLGLFLLRTFGTQEMIASIMLRYINLIMLAIAEAAAIGVKACSGPP